MPLVPELGFIPDLDAIPEDALERARLMFLNYPNNPTGAVVPDGFFERVVELAREHEILVIHDNAYSETTFDGYVAPSFLATRGRQGRRDRGLLALEGLQHDRLADRRADGQPRRDPLLLAAQDPRRLGDVGGGTARRRRGAARRARAEGRGDERDLRAPPRPHRRDAREIGVEVEPPKGTIYIWAPVPGDHTSTSFAELVLEEAAVVISPGSMYGPSGEGFFRISLTAPDERLTEALERMRKHLS